MNITQHPIKLSLNKKFPIFLMMCLFTLPALTATITVDAPDGAVAVDGFCSISEAIQAANTDLAVNECDAGSGEDTINLSVDVTLMVQFENHGTFGRTGTPAMSSTIILDGQGHILQRDSTLSCVLNGSSAATEFRLLRTTNTADLTLQNISLMHGCADGTGFSRSDGGGLYNDGTINSIQNSIFSNNLARDKGGGIFNDRDITTIQNSTFSSNSAGSLGGGILNHRTITAIQNSTFSNNSANDGGGIANGFIPSGNSNIITIQNSTFTSNTADNGGGGILNGVGSQITTIRNSTFFGNSANTAGGIVNIGNTLSLNNTILSNNTGGDCVSAGAINGSNNLIDDGGCAGASTVTSLAMVTNIDPVLRDNGCVVPTADGSCVMTHALLAGSNALDIAVGGTSTDQRGFASAGTRDIGAYEFHQASIGIAKDVNVSNFQVTFDYYLENFGNNILDNLSLAEDLDAVFGAGNYSISSAFSFIDDPATLTLNGGFDGSSDPSIISTGSLNVGDTAQIRLVIDVTTVIDSGSGLGVYSTQNTLSAMTPVGNMISDVSDNGTDPDPDGNGDPTEAGENDPSPFSISPPPAFSLLFNPDSLTIGDSSQLSYNIDNSGGFDANTALAFVNNFPAGFEIAAIPNITSGCGGSLTAVAGSTSVSLTGGTVAASSSCVISIDVTATQAGTLVNTSGDLISSAGNSGTASDTLTVLANLGGTISGLTGANTITLQNNNTNDLIINTDGSFTFSNSIANGIAYEVTILTQPLTQYCVLSNETGTIAGSNVTDVQVMCTDFSLSLDSNNLDFGNIFIANSSQLSLTISNTGVGNVIISSYVHPNPPFYIVGGSCNNLPVTLSTSQSCELIVEFRGNDAGIFADSLSIISNAASSPDTVALLGGLSIQIIPSLNIYGLLLMIGLLLLMVFQANYRGLFKTNP